MDQREAETDGDGGEALRGALVSGAENDEQKEGGQENFGKKARDERVVFRRVIAVAVRGEAAGERKSGVAAGDDVENSRSANSSKELCTDVGGKLGGGEAFSGNKADGDGGVQMAPGDVADGEGHGQDSQTERKRYANIADAEMNARGKDGAAATAEDKPESAEEFGCCTFGEMHGSPALSHG